jgi:hypothetical protein
MTYSDSERKRVLIAQAAVFRHGLLTSRDQVRQDLHPQALMQAALHQVTGHAGAAVGGLFSLEALRSGNYKMLLPVVQTAIALMPKKRLLRAIASRRVLRLGAVAAVVALCVYGLRHRKREPANR